MVQAAGRCNREGQLDRGKVVLFWPEEGTTPRGPYRVGVEKARLLLEEHRPERLHDPDLYRIYFKELFTTVKTDKGIQEHRKDLDYPEVAQRYRLIQEDTVSVVVSYGEGLARLEAFRNTPSLQNWRRSRPTWWGSSATRCGKSATFWRPCRASAIFTFGVGYMTPSGDSWRSMLIPVTDRLGG